MLLHIVPTFYAPYSDVRVNSVAIEPFGILLTAEHLKAGRPYRDKNYVIASSTNTRRFEVGFLLDIAKPVETYTALTQWDIGSRSVTYQLEAQIIDQAHQLISEDVYLWGARMSWDNRIPEKYRGAGYKDFSPCMHARTGDVFEPSRLTTFDDVQDGLIISRRQGLSLPTLQVERLSLAGYKIPSFVSTYARVSHYRQGTNIY